MAVFTSVSREEADAWLAGYGLGELLEVQGIAAGVENTNFFVTTSAGRYVLTIFEKLTFAELPFYLALMDHLASRQIPCPRPVKANDNSVLRKLKGKPASLVTRLTGEAVVLPSADQCAEVGALLARMHLAVRDFRNGPPNPRGLPWWIGTAPKVSPFLDRERRAALAGELAYQSSLTGTGLPRGPVHADLFRDNVLFDGGDIGGVIDFYFAGVDTFLFDVAVTLNDWCIDHATGAIVADKARRFVDAYRAERPFCDEERAAWHAMLRAAALRFWLSRLYDFYLPRPGHLVKAHDPEHFYRILRLRVLEPGAAPLI